MNILSRPLHEFLLGEHNVYVARMLVRVRTVNGDLMKLWTRSLDILLMISVLISGVACAQHRQGELTAKPEAASHDEIAATEPAVSTEDIVAAVNRHARTTNSWDVNYIVKWEQRASSEQGRNNLAMHRETSVQEAAQERCISLDVVDHTWTESNLAGPPADDQKSHMVGAFDGQVLRQLAPEKKQGAVLKWKKNEFSANTPLQYRTMFWHRAAEADGLSGPQSDPDPLPECSRS